PQNTTNLTGTPLKGSSPTARVRGFLDAHTHIGAYEFLGGRFHCGRPWSPYGVTVALQDCPDHEPNGAAAVAENFFVTGTPVGTHSTDGWPTDARRVINSGKLAVVLGVEISEVLGCGNTDGTPDCDRPQIDRELDELYRLGVRSLFPVHKFDNALGGTAFDNGGTGLLVNV